MFSLVSLFIKIRIFHSCHTRVVGVALVLHSCRSLRTLVALSAHSCRSCLTCVALFSLVSHLCRLSLALVLQNRLDQLLKTMQVHSLTRSTTLAKAVYQILNLSVPCKALTRRIWRRLDLF